MPAALRARWLRAWVSPSICTPMPGHFSRKRPMRGGGHSSPSEGLQLTLIARGPAPCPSARTAPAPARRRPPLCWRKAPGPGGQGDSAPLSFEKRYAKPLFQPGDTLGHRALRHEKTLCRCLKGRCLGGDLKHPEIGAERGGEAVSGHGGGLGGFARVHSLGVLVGSESIVKWIVPPPRPNVEGRIC